MIAPAPTPDPFDLYSIRWSAVLSVRQQIQIDAAKEAA
jgi:hypothetical protein